MTRSNATPLASTQQAVWLDQLLAPQLPCYTVGGALQFDGRIRLDLWERAIAELVRRHDALRLVLLDTPPAASQKVLDELAFKLEVHDYSAHADGEQRAWDHIRTAFSEPFALYGSVLWTMQWVQASPTRGLCLVRCHHLVADGMSVALILHAIIDVYNRLARGEPLDSEPAPSYLDFVADDLAYQRSARYAKDQAFWFERFNGSADPLFPIAARQAARRATQQVVWEIERAEFSRMAALGARLGGSITHMLIGALAIHYSRVAGRPEVVIGMPVHNRKNAAEKRTMGMFSSMLPLTAAVDAHASFEDTIRALVAQSRACYRHQRFPLYEIARHAQRHGAQHRLFDLSVSVEHFPFDFVIEGGRIVMVAQHNGFEDVPLALYLRDYEKARSVRVEFNFDPQILTREEVEASVRRIERLLHVAVDAPHTSVRQLPLLSERERRQVVQGFNETGSTFPAGRCIHELFEEQAARAPEAPALVCEDTSLGYAELNARANRLAHHLVALGITPDTCVAVALPRSAELVVALLATLKAGGAYVPLDPDYPAERLAFMLQDSSPRVLITTAACAERLPAQAGAHVIWLDEPEPAWAKLPAEMLSARRLGLQPRHLAYVIYTSGSTGMPKGVMIEHGALVNYTLGAVALFGLRAADRVLQQNSINFDLSLEEILPALAAGACLQIQRMPMLAGTMPGAASVVHLTAAHWHALVSDWHRAPGQARAQLSGVRLINVTGDALSPQLLAHWAALGLPTRLVNTYGPTETTVSCTAAYLADARSDATHERVTIGQPMANVRMVVLDPWGQPAPIGVAGDLYVGGVQVGRGYLSRPELTAERFVPDPFAEQPGARMYQTGDLARWVIDAQGQGTIEFLGRRDHQVKVRGFRIELGEIEATLLSCPGVREAVAIAREHAPGDKRLVAYVTGDHPLQPEALRAHVAQRLPEYMVPAAYVQLDTLPLTPNGKLDRRALPAPQDGAFGACADEPPQGELEATLAALWSELLGLERIGRHDGFFELGGHSLHALQLASRIRARLGCDVPLADLFEQPTLAGYARRVAAAGASTLPAIVPASRDEPLPLSFAQQRLWFLAQLDGRPTASYSMPGGLRLVGALDSAALHAALDRLVARHEALRTCFVSVDGAPVQRIAPPEVGFALDQVDLSEDPRAESEVQRLAAEEAAAPFDLERGPLIRGRLVRLAAHEHVLLLTMHHIVSDGWSIAVLLQELCALYAAFVQGHADPLPPLAIQYADYAVWQRRWIAGEALERQLDFWRTHLSGAPARLELPTDRPRPAMQDHAGASLAFELDAELTTALHALSRRHGTTLFMTLLASWAALLSRLSGQAEVVIGTPVAHRTRAEVEPLIGLFVNTQALRIDLSGSPSVTALLAQVRTIALAAQDHQDVPFEQVVEALKPVRSMAHSPVFQAMFAWQNTPESRLDMPGLQAQLLETPARFAPFDFDVSMHQTGEHLAGSVTYASALFDAPTIERWLGHWQTLLRAMAADDAALVPRLPLLSAHERDLLLHVWNATKAAFPAERCIHALFEQQAARTPEAAALVFEDTTLTYAELDAQAHRLARHLVALGVRPDTRVAIALPRSADMVVALLATLKAGGAYVPLDPSYPAERLAHMLEDSAPRVLITQARFGPLATPSDVPVIALDDPQRPWERQPQAHPGPLAPGLTPRHLAYVLYTSGSTGRPKGVMVEHASLANQVLALQARYALDRRDRVLQFAPFTFDMSVEETFGALCSGAALVLRTDAWVADAQTFWALCERHAVTVANLPVAFWQLLARERDARIAPCVRQVMIGGEAVTDEAIQQWHERDGWRPALFNAYGPTEATVNATVHRIEPGAGRAGCIGRPLANTRVYVLDAIGQPVPIGVAGELYIGGAQLARGYLNRPELTALRFVPDPCAVAGTPNARMYQTGDLARWRPDGTIEFLGRNDQQVKVRGFRIELGEIESALLSCPGVREAVVLAREDVPGDKQLVAYLTGDESLPPDALRAHLAAQLPEYMVPAAYMQLDALPRLSNGKLDRRALPAPQHGAFSAHAYEPPQGELEATLAALWSELLGRERIGRHDDFFALGGHSLLAVQLASRIRVRMGREVPLAELFAEPELAGYARRVAASGANTLPAIVPVSRAEPLPMSFAQQRLWFLAQLDERAGAAYLIQGGVRLRGTLDVAALRSALDRVVVRHEALRTRFASVDGVPVQVIAPPDVGFALVQTDLSGQSDPEAGLERLVAEEAFTSFDLQQGPLIRGQLVRLADNDHALLVTMHHIVSDGWSMGVLTEELAALYAAGSQGSARPSQVSLSPAGGGHSEHRPDPLPALPVQYADYAAWQRQWMSGEVLQRQLDFWRAHLSGAPALLELPTDRPRPPVQDYAGAVVGFELDAELSTALKALSRRHGATLFMTLLAAWAALLSRLSGQDEVVIGTPVANRHRTEIEPLIGFFVNTLALRVDLSVQPSVTQLLAQVRTTTLAAQAHQDVPFEQVVEALRPARSMAHSPLFQAWFDWQDASKEELRLPGITLHAIAAPQSTTQFDLMLSMHDAGELIAGNLGYASALFEAHTIERLVGHWKTLLRAMAADDTQAVHRLSLLTPQEHHQLVHGWNATEAVFPAERCIHVLFEEQVARTPDATALVFEDRTLSYAELNAQANRLAHYLIALGVRPDTRVALALPRGLDMVVAVLATLKAGGAYVPLDPDYPPERLAFMLVDSAPHVLLTHTSVSAALGALPASLPVLTLDADVWSGLPITNPDCAAWGLTPAHLAYVIYTSGSTGTPKGVLVEHAQVVRLFGATRHGFAFGAKDVWTLFHSYAFDFSVWELWGALLHGGRLVVVPHLRARSPREFYALLCEQGVTVLNQTPSAFRQLMAAQAESPHDHSLRCVIFGGEALEPATLAPWYARNGERTQLVNMYGITETTVHVTWRPLTPEDTTRSSSPMGVPIPDLRVILLDRHGQLVPIGVAGELHVGGAGVTRGYLNRPDLTALRFVPDPYTEQPGARMYRTGDLGRRLADGTLEFLGRNDQQVKVRGFRIEPGEIEARLLQHPGVREAIVLAREDAPGDKRLVAYVTGDESAQPEALRAHLAVHLPDHMVPAAYVQLDALPLTPHGKLDRRALPAPEDSAFGKRTYEAPQGELEATLAAIWRELLGLERVGRHDHFFELGGHSLLAVQMISHIRTQLGQQLALAQLFAHPTLSRFAEQVQAAAQTTRRPVTPTDRSRYRVRLRPNLSGYSQVE